VLQGSLPQKQLRAPFPREKTSERETGMFADPVLPYSTKTENSKQLGIAWDTQRSSNEIYAPNPRSKKTKKPNDKRAQRSTHIAWPPPSLHSICLLLRPISASVLEPLTRPKSRGKTSPRCPEKTDKKQDTKTTWSAANTKRETRKERKTKQPHATQQPSVPNVHNLSSSRAPTT